MNLQSITLLELAQVHYGCGLPNPIQLYVSFEPHRFITRFNAIQQEVQAQLRRESEETEDIPIDDEEHEEEHVEEESKVEESKVEDGVAGEHVQDSHDERENKREEYTRQKRPREDGEFRSPYLASTSS